jgi:transaldolase
MSDPWLRCSSADGNVAVDKEVPHALREPTNQLGIAIAGRAHESYCRLLDSPRWKRTLNAGARVQRLLWASIGTKDPKVSDILYVRGLAAPFTVNTMPEATLKAFADHGEMAETLSVHTEEVLAKFAKAGIDMDALAAQLLDEGAAGFVRSWKDLMECIASKSVMLKAA